MYSTVCVSVFVCCPASFSQLTLLPRCDDMCEDFVPDLNFRFSLGMSTLLVRVRGLEGVKSGVEGEGEG